MLWGQSGSAESKVLFHEFLTTAGLELRHFFFPYRGNAVLNIAKCVNCNWIVRTMLISIIKKKATLISFK